MAKQPSVNEALALFTLDAWVRRLAEVCPPAQGLTSQQVRAQLKARYFDLAEWEQAKPPAHFKSVLHAIAASQPTWLYASDWKGSRTEAARAFERLLGLPNNHLSPEPTVPLVLLADEANGAAEELGTKDERLHTIAPFDDDCVFALLSPSVLDGLIAAGLIDPSNGGAAATSSEAPITASKSDYVEQVAAFSNDALNLFQNMGIETVGQLVATSEARLRRMSRDGRVVAHIKAVLERAGLYLVP